MKNGDEKQLRNINDKLIKLLSRMDLVNARLNQIVHMLENIDNWLNPDVEIRED